MMENPEMIPQRVTQVQANSGHTEWVTPSYILDAARNTFGHGGIDLDPASSDLAQTKVRAARYYTKERNGLSYNWTGRNIWLNPPYTAKDMTAFIDHLALNRPFYGEACVITNSATETRWAQMLGRLSAAICLLDKRVAFLRPTEDGKELYTPKHGSLQGQMVWYIGDAPDQFGLAFEQLGVCFGREPIGQVIFPTPIGRIVETAE